MNMTPEEQMRRDISEIKQDIRDIKIVAFGSEKLGVSGFAIRVHRLEKKLRWFELRLASFIGAMLALWEATKLWIENKRP